MSRLRNPQAPLRFSKAVLETFLNASGGDAVCDAWEPRASCSADCP